MSITNHPPDVRFGTIRSKLAGKGGRMQAKEDRRVGRTRKLLEDALHDLIVEKGYEAVTVQDIIDRANVGRSTFYAHYTDKQQLLFSHFADLEAHLAHQQRLVRAKSADPVERVFGFSLAMFQHAQEYRRLWGRRHDPCALPAVFAVGEPDHHEVEDRQPKKTDGKSESHSVDLVDDEDDQEHDHPRVGPDLVPEQRGHEHDLDDAMQQQVGGPEL